MRDFAANLDGVAREREREAMDLLGKIEPPTAETTALIDVYVNVMRQGFCGLPAIGIHLTPLPGETP